MRTDIRAARSVTPHVKTPGSRRPLALRSLIALLVFQGLTALGGGLAFIAEPNGALVGIKRSVLQNTPVGSFLIPGLLLAIPLGLVPLLIARDIAHNWRHPWAARVELLIGVSVGWAGSLAVGLGLIVWIVVEYLMIDYHWLQAVMGVVGVAITALTLLPSIRRRFTIVQIR